MDLNKVVKNENGDFISVSFLGFFRVPDLDKEYAMYALMDDNDDNEHGSVLLGEVIREDGNVQILGIKDEEKDLVVAYYNEISNQIGGE